MNAITNVPPDPDGENDDRAIYANTAINAFAQITGMDKANEDDKTILGDLLCDLMHWCDRRGIDFTRAVYDAVVVYREETAPR